MAVARTTVRLSFRYPDPERRGRGVAKGGGWSSKAVCARVIRDAPSGLRWRTGAGGITIPLGRPRGRRRPDSVGTLPQKARTSRRPPTCYCAPRLSKVKRVNLSSSAHNSAALRLARPVSGTVSGGEPQAAANAPARQEQSCASAIKHSLRRSQMLHAEELL